MIRLSNVKIRANLDDREVIENALRKYNIKPHEIKSAYIYKRSIDARNKKDIYYNYAVDVELKTDRNIKGARRTINILFAPLPLKYNIIITFYIARK